jgi:hypothetical protein
MPLVPHWTARVEYPYSDFGTSSVTFPLAGQRFDSNLTTQEVRVGLNYQLGEAAAKAGNGGIAPLEGDNWAIHGQTTFVSQFGLGAGDAAARAVLTRPRRHGWPRRRSTAAKTSGKPKRKNGSAAFMLCSPPRHG